MYDLNPILKQAAETNAIFKIKEIQDLGGGRYRFFSCDNKTYWLKPCMKIQIKQTTGNFLMLEVVEVVNNNYFEAVFDGTLVQLEDEFFVEAGSFVHGTLPMADVEVNRIGNGNPTKQNFKPLPLVYHQEIYRKQKQTIESSYDYIAQNLRIYFLDDYLQKTEWLTDDHYNNIIYQMENYANFFVENLKNDIKIDRQYIEFNTHDIIFRVKTGEYVSGKNVKSVFARNLSGVELVISLAVNKNFCDNNTCC